MNRKTTKRALGLSFVSLLLCFTMLMGTTFAWFTDNATVAVNTIQAGKLDIELLDGNTENANSLEGKTLTFKKADGAPANEPVLFEPCAKYSLTQVYLHNAGNLYAKYQVTITGIDGSSKLAEVLDVYVAGNKVGTLASLVANGGVINSSTIAPNAYYTFGTIELEMQTTAGNEYQEKTIEGIAITVQATQATAEYDSNNNQYDAGAQFDKLVVAATQTELNDAISNASVGEPVTVSLLPLAEGQKYTLPADNDMKNKDITFTGTKDTVIEVQKDYPTGANVSFSGVTVETKNEQYAGLMHAKKVVYKDCTLKGTQWLYAENVEFINCTFEVTGDAYAVWTYSAKNVTFTDCTFKTDGKAILVYNDAESEGYVGNISLNNCTFTAVSGNGYDKAAVETGCNAHLYNRCSNNSNKFNLTFKGCTVGSGYTENKSTSALWGNKNSMCTNHLNVIIDGVDVY